MLCNSCNLDVSIRAMNIKFSASHKKNLVIKPTTSHIVAFSSGRIPSFETSFHSIVVTAEKSRSSETFVTLHSNHHSVSGIPV